MRNRFFYEDCFVVSSESDNTQKKNLVCNNDMTDAIEDIVKDVVYEVQGAE